MKYKILFVLLIIGMVAGSVFAGAAGPEANKPIREEIVRAVDNLCAPGPDGRCTNVAKNTRICVDNLKGDTKTNDITDYLLTALTRAGYVVFDRRHLDNILEQQKMEFGDYFDPASVKAIGYIKGVDAIIYGSVKEYSSFGGKTRLNAHIQLTHLETGSTSWSYDLGVEAVSKGRKMFYSVLAGGALLLIAVVFFGLKKSGQTKVINS